MNILNKRLLLILLIIPFLLLLPLLAMQFSDEVNWTVFDFMAMALLLSLVAILIEITLRLKIIRNYKIILFLSIVAFFFLLWAELAVGLFDSMLGGS